MKPLLHSGRLTSSTGQHASHFADGKTEALAWVKEFAQPHRTFSAGGGWSLGSACCSKLSPLRDKDSHGPFPSSLNLHPPPSKSTPALLHWGSLSRVLGVPCPHCSTTIDFVPSFARTGKRDKTSGKAWQGHLELPGT